jgi:GNAT superfamily N-acetyltransferase
MQELAFDPDDLAPGDRDSALLPVIRFEVRRVKSIDDPLFQTAYDQLWEQFGAANEIEMAEVLGRRLEWPFTADADGVAMRYDLILMQSAGDFVAVRDHIAVADRDAVVVHLSHVLLAPEWRRTGLAGYLRAFPIQTAHRCLKDAGLPHDVPITLVAEMEYPDGVDESRVFRLKSYEKAGFKKIDPAVVHYQQPDFRPADKIDATGGPVPLPFQLVVRRVGKESEDEISGAEVRTIVSRLYRLYGREFRPQDMEVVTRQLVDYPPPDSIIRLLPPTA